MDEQNLLEANADFKPSANGDGVATDRPARSFLVVGIGASAGGLEALEQFFDSLQTDSGMAFVVVQHLSPDFLSLMDELLARHTRVPIHKVEDGMQVEPNAIYLIPPRKEMIISGGKLLLTDKDPAQALSLPIDTFFRSLAQDMGERAVAIVLSGTGSDGSRGVRAVHEAGGLVLAQDEITAKFDGMPRSAVETGVVDAVAPPDRMPAMLAEHARRTPAELMEEGERVAHLEGGITAIFRLLREHYGIDFSHYKPSTVLRRIERRLQLHNSVDLDEYVDRLENDSAELNSLYKDLLIGVTRFFRDREAFEELERQVIPQILSTVPATEEIRVWVAGCATGEEAYSIAILFFEALENARRPVQLKIFATDVHRQSLDFASQGVYRQESLQDMSSERLKRFFVRQDQEYHVVPDLRKVIVFAPHNIAKDAPFTKLDLVTCRNLLIYLRPAAQRKALSLFHFGLKAGGTLFLGPSETPGDLDEEFEAIHQHWRIYRKRRDVRLSPDLRMSLGTGYPQRRALAVVTPAQANVDASLLRAYDSLIDEFELQGLLINERREVVHVFGGASKFLSHRDGRPSTDLLDLIVKDLKLVLATAIQRVNKELKPVKYGSIQVQTLDGARSVKLTVKPIGPRGHETQYLLVLVSSADQVLPPQDEQALDVAQASDARMQGLEHELQYTKENLQATIEELETSNEELQAANEELVASNEELQSTNEELHSVNEELYTVNAEYQRKIGELTQMTADMDNLLRSTDVGTIFLDRDLRIRRFTPKVAESFSLLPHDIGRRIDHFSSALFYPDLLHDMHQVLASGERVDREIQDQKGNWLLLRMLPYTSGAGDDGAVITLIDISSLKKTEASLRRMSKVFHDTADPIVLEDLDGTIVDVNAEAERFYGWKRAELIGRPYSVLLPQDQHAEATELRRQCRDNDFVRNVESVKLNRNGQRHPVLLTLSLLTDESGKPGGIASIAKDITRIKRAEQESRDAVRRRDQFLAMLSHELRNPLGALVNATFVLERQPDDRHVIRDACDIISRQARQIARLLDDLLDVSRVMQGKIEMRREVLNLSALVPEAVQVVRPQIDAQGHTIDVQVPTEPVFVQGDSARLLQIQENLLVNAAKYTPRGGRIWIRLTVERDEAVLVVGDNGQGIPPDMVESIFDLFVQGPASLARTEGGMGVGLTLVRTLVNKHNGSIMAFSRGLGQGSEFVVRVPLAKAEVKTTPAKDHRPALSKAKNLRIVVVEDNSDARAMLRTLLKMDGHRVTVAEDGLAGAEAIVNERPDIALVDIGLPGLTGYEVAQKVREQVGPDGVMLVALTGYGRAEDRQQVLQAGFDAHIVKPLTLEELHKMFERYWAKKNAEQTQSS